MSSERPARWALRLPAASAHAVGLLRLRPGILVTEAGDWLWLRGDGLDDELDLELRKVPGAVRFTVGDDDAVTEFGRRLPADVLPGSQWSELSAWLAPFPQPAALPGVLSAKAPLSIVRGAVELPATVLVTTVIAVAEYATSAAAVRLNRLQLAAAADGRAVLRGDPLPPLPGRRYADEDGVAVPCGFALVPQLGAAALRALLGLGDGDLALFHEDGTYEHVAASSFTRATRGAARATRDALAAGRAQS